MKMLSMQDWASLAHQDIEAWRAQIDASVERCLKSTQTSVVSAVTSDDVSSIHGACFGIPYGLKDLFDYKGVPTHSSSALPFLLDRPVSADSELVLRLRELGAVCAAKTQMNEFAYGLSGENSHYGNCPHPTLSGCLSGGSSSGSAHMVAAGYLPLAFGTDTGGSIRLPAAWCGLYGVRWVPDYFMRGGFPLAPSFDTMGWFNRSAADMTFMLKAWFEASAASPLKSISGTAFLPQTMVDAETLDASSKYLAKMELAELPADSGLLQLLPACQQAFNVLQSREAYCIHKEWLQSHTSVYDPAVKMRIERGMAWTTGEIDSALETSDVIKKWFSDYFKEHDYLVMPVCPGPAIPPDAATSDLREKTLQLTTPASLAGLPALTVPVWLDAKRSVGLQFIFKEVGAAVPLAILKRCGNI